MGQEKQGCRRARGRPRCSGKEAAILDAALTLLARHGFTRMTLDRVARAAGVSKATIHLRWRTKADLVAAALKTLRPCSVAGALVAGAPAPSEFEASEFEASAFGAGGPVGGGGDAGGSGTASGRVGPAVIAGGTRAALACQLAVLAEWLTRRHGMALMGACLAEEEHHPHLLYLLREYVVLPSRAALLGILEQARDQGELPVDTPVDTLGSALLGALYADCLAGRTAGSDWARHTVDVVFGPYEAPRDRP